MGKNGNGTVTEQNHIFSVKSLNGKIIKFTALESGCLMGQIAISTL